MASITFGTKTFGEKPQKFQIEEGEEYYYVGSEVGDLLWIILFSKITVRHKPVLLKNL